MANSIGYLLSLNAYSTGAEAAAEGVSQGARVVYATTDTLSTSNLLYGDSRLTQPVFGLVGNYYGVQLLTDDTVDYVVTFSETGVISFYTPPTTTTTAPTTTTTTVPATTTTTTISYSIYPVVIDGGNVCYAPGNQVSIGGNVSADSTIYGNFGASGYSGGSLIWVRYTDNAVTFVRQFYVNMNETSADYMNLQSTC